MENDDDNESLIHKARDEDDLTESVVDEEGDNFDDFQSSSKMLSSEQSEKNYALDQTQEDISEMPNFEGEETMLDDVQSQNQTLLADDKYLGKSSAYNELGVRDLIEARNHTE